MEVKNTLAYYNMATITAVKGFIAQAPGSNQTKLFWRNLRLHIDVIPQQLG
jgi:hypothetical protein